jgi:hypothetical protein
MEKRLNVFAVVGLVFVSAYPNDVLVTTKGSYKECLRNLEQVFEKLDTGKL